MGVRSTNEGNAVSQVSSQTSGPGNLFSTVGPNERAASPYDATGGTKSTPGDGYVYHVFTSSGSWQVNSAGGNVDYVLIAGGGGGGWDRGGGGGAGAYVSGTIPTAVVEGAGTGSFAVTIGSGGAGATNDPTTRSGADGSNSTWAYVLPTAPTGLIAKGGGGGGGNPKNTHGTGRSSSDPFGGSGGGAEGSPNDPTQQGGAGGTYGNPGFAQGPPYDSGGGGGAGTGGPVTTHNKTGGNGSQNPWALPTWGVAHPTSPTVRMFAGGGGGTTLTTGPTISPGAGGTGGGGYGGGPNPAHPPGVGGDATNNTGSGGGGGSGAGDASGDGGPGILMIRYSV